MRYRALIVLLAVVLAGLAVPALPQQRPAPYKVLMTKTVGGDGRFDYLAADAATRRLYVPRLGPAGAIAVFDLDTLAPAGTIAQTSGHGVVVDGHTHHAFASSKPVAMWDASSLQPIKTIDVAGNPDSIGIDPTDGRIYVMSQQSPNLTVIDPKDGAIAGTADLGGVPEQDVSDGNGHLYVNLVDKASIAVIDEKTLTVTARYDLGSAGGTCAGLAMDRKNGILFAGCRNPQALVAVNARDGRVLAAIPIGSGNDGVAFNPATMEAFASQGDGTLAVIKEQSPASFSLEQVVQTKPYAKTLAIDTATNHVLLVTADFTPPPSPAPGARPGRPVMVPGSCTIIVVGT